MTHTPDFEECTDILRALLSSGSANGREDVRKYLLSRINQLAAAPDLLAALKSLLESGYPTAGDGSHFWSGPYATPNHPAVIARAAIAKAEGRT